MESEPKKRKEKSTVALIAGREYVSFHKLYTLFAQHTSLKNFKSMLEGNNITPAFAGSRTKWYDLQKTADFFNSLHNT
jgi:hypothetical protein